MEQPPPDTLATELNPLAMLAPVTTSTQSTYEAALKAMRSYGRNKRGQEEGDTDILPISLTDMVHDLQERRDLSDASSTALHCCGAPA